MFHLAAWYESVDPAGAYDQLNAVPDQALTVSGVNVQVPALNKIVAMAGGAENTVAPRLRLAAPVLRTKSLFQIAPLSTASAGAVEPLSPHSIVDLRKTPLQMVTGEQLVMELLSNPAAAQIQWALAWLADGPIEQVTGDVFTVRATASATLTAGSWTNTALTFDENLPRGRYAIVGMKAISAGLIAARLVLPDIKWRPGVLGNDLVEDIEWPGFRYGGMGVFGEFEDVDGFTADFLSVSGDTAETVYVDLIQRRNGPA
jgi:hypothetical protein